MEVLPQAKVGLECHFNNVCVQYSSVGNSVPISKLLAEIETSPRQGRDYSEPRFFHHDNGSYSFIKDVGTQWISTLINFFQPSKHDEKLKTRNRRKQRRQRRKRRRKGSRKRLREKFALEDEKVAPQFEKVALEHGKFPYDRKKVAHEYERRPPVLDFRPFDYEDIGNLPEFEELPQVNPEDWHKKWANLNYLSGGHYSTEDLGESEMSQIFQDEERNQEADSDFSPTITVVKYVPYFPKDILPYLESSFKDEDEIGSEVLRRHLSDDLSLAQSRTIVRSRKQGANSLDSTNHKFGRRFNNLKLRPDLQAMESEIVDDVEIAKSDGLDSIERRDKKRNQRRRSSIPLVPIFVSLLPVFLLMGFILGAAITFSTKTSSSSSSLTINGTSSSSTSTNTINSPSTSTSSNNNNNVNNVPSGRRKRSVFYRGKKRGRKNISFQVEMFLTWLEDVFEDYKQPILQNNHSRLNL